MAEFTSDYILLETMKHFNVNVHQILSKSKQPVVVDARHCMMQILRMKARWTYKGIGGYMRKDHTTAMNACDNIRLFQLSDDRNAILEAIRNAK